MLTCALQEEGSYNHPTKYKQDAAQRGRVEGLLRAPQAAAIRPHISVHVAQLKPENPEKNPRSTGETNYNNSTRIGSTLRNLKRHRTFFIRLSMLISIHSRKV